MALLESHWFSLVQFVLTGVIGFGVWSTRNAFRGGEWATRMDMRIDGLEKRMDQAGEKLSDLASEVQGLPERMRTIFVAHAECQLIHREMEREQKAIWEALRDKTKRP